MERCPSFAFFSGLGPMMKDAVTTNLHLKCCPARPPAYTALRFLHTNPSAFVLFKLALLCGPIRTASEDSPD